MRSPPHPELVAETRALLESLGLPHAASTAARLVDDVDMLVDRTPPWMPQVVRALRLRSELRLDRPDYELVHYDPAWLREHWGDGPEVREYSQPPEYFVALSELGVGVYDNDGSQMTYRVAGLGSVTTRFRSGSRAEIRVCPE